MKFGFVLEERVGAKRRCLTLANVPDQYWKGQRHASLTRMLPSDDHGNQSRPGMDRTAQIFPLNGLLWKALELETEGLHSGSFVNELVALRQHRTGSYTYAIGQLGLRSPTWRMSGCGEKNGNGRRTWQSATIDENPISHQTPHRPRSGLR
jgi:hypothetical protein